MLDDGRALAESGAILFYFGEGTELVPTDRYERAQMLQWMFFEQYDLEPTIAVLRFWALADLHQPDDAVAAKRAGGERVLAALDAHLATRDFLVGERFTLADIAVYGYTHIAPEGGFSLQPYPAVEAWLARVAAQPGHISMTD